MKKSYIIAGAVVFLGLVVCLIRVNPSFSGGNKQVSGAPTQTEGANVDGELSDEKNPVAGKEMKFDSKDLEGNKVDSSVFKGKKISVINIWGTFCSPCVEEIPELQKLAEEYKDKINMIGVVTDPENAKDAKEMLESKKITYMNILANDSMSEILNKFEYVPVTLFVDESGKILDTFIPGSTDYKTLKGIVDGLLKK